MSKTINIDLTPDPKILEVLGTGRNYKLHEALGELIDNSIDARIDGQNLSVTVDIGKNEIIVSDNAIGMNQEEASNCLKAGKSTKVNMRGLFGLGLNTSTRSLGSSLKIETEKLGNDEKYTLNYTTGDLQQRNSYKMDMGVGKSSLTKHGTKITIFDLIKKYTSSTVLTTISELTKLFNNLLKDGVTLKVNGHTCKPFDVKLIDDKQYLINFKLSNGEEINGWVGFMETPATYDYGFNTYRHKRLITQYDKIGFKPHPTLNRLYGELNMEPIPVSNDKREWITESPEYVEFLEQMDNVMIHHTMNLRKKHQQFHDEKNKVNGNNIANDVLKGLTENKEDFESFDLGGVKKIKDDNGDNEGSVPDSKTKPTPTKPTTSKPTPPVPPVPPVSLVDLPLDKKKIKKYKIEVDGKKYEVNVKFENLGDESIIKHHDIEDGVFVIEINTSSPQYKFANKTVGGITIFTLFVVCESFTEQSSKENDLDYERIIKIRDTFMKNYSKQRLNDTIDEI